MSEVFSTRFQAGWATMDANAHLANTAFLDAVVDYRMTYFSGHGFPAREFRRPGLGPVVHRDVLEYFREILLLEPFDVTLRLAGPVDTLPDPSAGGSAGCPSGTGSHGRLPGVRFERQG
jgi:acyl-CoA thioesterase FadM